MSAQKIGRYEIVKEIGRGGMAIVYLARDPSFERQVAIKVLRREFTDDRQFRARFVRGAKVIVSLEHPCIVPVYDYGEEDDQPYIVMPYMTGGTLSDRIAGKPMPLSMVVPIIQRLAEALQAAHRQGIIHRDLKPGHVLFDADGHAFLSGFGAAMLKGAREIDGRSDIYSLGVILYEMLTGHLPYQADTPLALLLKHVTEPIPPLNAEALGLPAELELIIRRALAKRPEDRYSTAEELVLALSRYQTPPTTPGAAPTAPKGGAQSPVSEMESPESSSPIVTRAVAAGLRGEYCDIYEFPAWQKSALRLLGGLPQGAARFAISRFQLLSGLPPQKVAGLSIEQLAALRLKDYDRAPGRFPALAIGVALGGATAHLALTLGGPFLPQAFVLTLKGGSPTGDVSTYFQRSAVLARDIARDNPNVMTIQHFDPVHDGWLTRWVNHVRLKLLGLPGAYADFIRQRLEPGGDICYLDCGAEWLRFRVGERSVFQVGGWGDVSPDEFIEGSDRIRRVCRAEGLSVFDWRLPDFPLERGPESEWGAEPGLGEALEAFCQREGYRFVRIRLSQPHDFSRLAFRAVARLLEKEGRAPAGAFVEMFTQFDATAVRRSGLLPLWLVFNTQDSLDFLRRMIPQFPVDKPVFFSPLSTFSITPDLVPWSEWESALRGLPWTNIGTRPSHYPADARALVTWTEELREWCEKNAQPIRGRLSVQELKELADAV